MNNDKLYDEAINDLNNENYGEALKKFITLFNSNFDDRSVFYFILNCIESSDEGPIKDAIENIKLDDNNPDSFFIKSYALNSVEEYEDAVKYIEDAIQLNPDNFHYHVLKMTEYVDLDKIEESESYEGIMETNQKVFVKIVLFNMFVASADEDFEGDLFEIIEYIDNFEDEDIEDFLNNHGGVEGLLNELDPANLQAEFDNDDDEIILDEDNVIEINPDDIDENGNITLKLDDNIDIELEDGSGIERDEEGNLVINVNNDIEEGEEEELEISPIPIYR
ncbi:M48 family metallopeptidase [uncultured Methanobrevibacter sp.]|uniref:tetratricopeptide repeat protein n=1 Tax=uncultured Methanobrevibacter sp. TaxID=253161 RepID=UPI0025F73C32|nr:hypothetical protein [uncultured Methanobrevibacter sp.]